MFLTCPLYITTKALPVSSCYSHPVGECSFDGILEMMRLLNVTQYTWPLVTIARYMTRASPRNKQIKLNDDEGDAEKTSVCKAYLFITNHGTKCLCTLQRGYPNALLRFPLTSAPMPAVTSIGKIWFFIIFCSYLCEMRRWDEIIFRIITLNLNSEGPVK